jgi:DNA-binding NarL/FixJ family response regulator
LIAMAATVARSIKRELDKANQPDKLKSPDATQATGGKLASWADSPVAMALDPDVVARLVGRKRKTSPLDNLTPRERKVLAQIAEGRSNAGIARELTVTVAAVERHVTSIFDTSACVSRPTSTAES